MLNQLNKEKMRYLLLLAIIIGSCTQKPLFVREAVSTNDLNDQTYLKLDESVLNSIRENKEDRLEITIPFQTTDIKLVLSRIEIYDPSFKVTTTDGVPVTYTSVFYSGKVKGDDESRVSITIGSEVSGIISSPSLGNISLGKNEYNYGTFNTLQIDQPSFNCDVLENEEIISLRNQINDQVQTQGASCITVDMESTYENYLKYGSSQAVTDWITSLFSAVKTFYLAEGIDINLKSIYIWTSEDPYSDNTSTALSQLQSSRSKDPAFTGTLCQLIRGRTGGSLSGIAWIGTACVASYRFSVAEPLFNYASYPSYSWSVNVIAHELGHNLGSPHTHSCTWPGGPIDDCYTAEGGCTPGPHPASGGGTMMSYCHLSGVGIRFSNGFGPLPNQKIKSSITCVCSITPPPPPTPTCSDGIQNGNETGVDCGGSCPPCQVQSANLALNKPATQSSKYNPLPNTNPNIYEASKIDDAIRGANNFTHTLAELQPWVQIDLGDVYDVSKIVIYNRSGCSQCSGRIKEFKVFASTLPVATYNTVGHVYQYTGSVSDGQAITVQTSTKARYIKLIVNNTSANYLHLSEIEVFGGTTVNPICRDTIYKIVKDSTIRINRDSVGKIDQFGNPCK